MGVGPPRSHTTAGQRQMGVGWVRICIDGFNASIRRAGGAGGGGRQAGLNAPAAREDEREASLVQDLTAERKSDPNECTAPVRQVGGAA